MTCHDIGGAERHAHSPESNPIFLREYPGDGLLAFCGRCHVRSSQADLFNPHIMLTVDNEIMPGACNFCHRPGIGAERRGSRTGSPELRTDELSICLSCHREHVDYFVPGHIGAQVGASMQAHLARVSEAQKSVSAESWTAALLPLASGNIVVCSTCHNPHQAGLFPRGSVLAMGAQDFEREYEELGLRGFGQRLCKTCHEK